MKKKKKFNILKRRDRKKELKKPKEQQVHTEIKFVHVLRLVEVNSWEVVQINYKYVQKGEYYVEYEPLKNKSASLYKKQYMEDTLRIIMTVTNSQAYIEKCLVSCVLHDYMENLEPIDNLGMRS